jgi:predicted phage-related endonuclease
MEHELEQGTDEWNEIRKGRVTGTRLKQVMSTTSDKLIYEMIAEKYETLAGYQSDDMSAGTLKEPWAISDYEKLTGQKVREVGFISKGSDVGLSPDGLIGESKAIEVKSPGIAKHIEYIVCDKIPAEYKWQVVHYFVVIDQLKELDFISYNPNFPLKELHIVNIKREDLESDIQKAKEKLEKFLLKYNETLLKLL